MPDDWATADAGLGLCLTCVSEYKGTDQTKARERTPKFAIVLAPTIVPIGSGIAVVAVGTCYDHIAGAPMRQSGLIPANGKVPR